MNAFKQRAMVIVCLLGFAAAAHAQFPNQHPDGIAMPSAEQATKDRVGGPVAAGQQMAQQDASHGVAIVQAAPVATTGGIVQLSAFGWLEPYVDSVVQSLIVAGLAWLGKSKYTQWMDQSARDALGTFTKNVASSLIADGFVRMDGKTVQVSSVALANEINTANDRIPDAMKRFGITPGGLAHKIVDAIPQTTAGAAIVAAAHAPPDAPPLADPVTSKTAPANPPTASS